MKIFQFFFIVIFQIIPYSTKPYSYNFLKLVQNDLQTAFFNIHSNATKTTKKKIARVLLINKILLSCPQCLKHKA